MSTNNTTNNTVVLLAIGIPSFLLFGKSTRLYKILHSWLCKARLTIQIRYSSLLHADATGSSPIVVSGLYVYPVKSLRAVPLNVTKLSTLGLMNDRRFIIERRSPSNPNKWRFLTQVRWYYANIIVHCAFDLH